jgi:hypothetical protein
MRLLRFAAVVIATPLLATACGLSPTSAASHPASSPTSANPDAGLLTGAQLNALLAPDSWFPSGYTADPTGSRSTGTTFVPPTAPGSLPCTRLDGTAWIDLSKVGAVSFAQDDYIDQDTSAEYAQEIDVFQGTGAQQAMAGLRSVATTCPSFPDSQTSSTVTVHLQDGPALGNDSLTFLLSDPSWAADTALEAVRVGSAVITVLYSGASGNGIPQATNLASLVAANVKSKIKN